MVEDENLSRGPVRYPFSVSECKHGVALERCFDCRRPPLGVNDVVYVTKGGTHFHNRPDCPNIEGGQSRASSLGMNTYPTESVPYSMVALERDRCSTCCPTVTQGDA